MFDAGLVYELQVFSGRVGQHDHECPTVPVSCVKDCRSNLLCRVAAYSVGHLPAPLGCIRALRRNRKAKIAPVESTFSSISFLQVGTPESMSCARKCAVLLVKQVNTTQANF